MSTIGGIVRDHREGILVIREGITIALQYIKIESDSMEAVRGLQTQTMVGGKLFFVSQQ